MPMLDVFRSDAFGVVSLTTAMNKLPYKPNRLGQLGLFQREGITTTSVVVEERLGKLMLIPNAGRGAQPNVLGGKQRKARSFVVTNLPQSANVMADDVQNVRAFGSETELETVSMLVNDKLMDLRNNIETTIEFHRCKAIQGLLVDADGATTIYDWYAEFGITPETSPVDFTANTVKAVKVSATNAIRKIQDNLGAETYSQIRCLCGSTFYDAVSMCTEVKNAYDRYQESSFLRGNVVRNEFEYAGVVYEEYRGMIGDVPFIPVGEGWYFPVGVSNVFKEVYAPAYFNETVNTRGLPVYAKQEEMKFGIGVELLALSCPLVYNSRPAVCIKSTLTGAPTVLDVGPGIANDTKTVK